MRGQSFSKELYFFQRENEEEWPSYVDACGIVYELAKKAAAPVNEYRSNSCLIQILCSVSQHLLMNLLIDHYPALDGDLVLVVRMLYFFPV